MNAKFPSSAILQVADCGPLESIVVMLRAVGITCLLPDAKLRAALRDLGCDTVLEIKSLVEGMGYDYPFPDAPLDYAGIPDMARSDVIYVDVKAHRNGPKVIKRWTNLQGKILWYRINGGKPEHVINDRGDHGDEVNPGCPVLTPNQWYRKNCICKADRTGPSAEAHVDDCPSGLGWTVRSYEDAYTCWPPFVKFSEYNYHDGHTVKDGRLINGKYTNPICLVHNADGWGYGPLIYRLREHLGVKVFGKSSPDGLLLHREVKSRLTTAIAMVHLKSSDAPGYAIYEALASGCPVVCSRRLIWRNRMQDLLIPDVTCLVFDRETHDALTQEDVLSCTEEIGGHLKALADPSYNAKIGFAGRQRLKDVMWSKDNRENVDSLATFMTRNFDAHKV